MRKRDGKPDYEALFGRIFGVVGLKTGAPRARTSMSASLT
jgi:hypothetical protein